MRSVARAVTLGACLLMLGAWFFLKARVQSGTVAGEVAWIGADSVAIAPDPGYRTLLGGLRRFPIAPVLALQLNAGDRIQAEFVRAPDGGSLIGKLRFLGRAAQKPAPDEGSSETLPIGAVLPALTVPGVDGAFHLGAGQGTPTVLAFLYTSCGIPTACPLLTQKLRKLQEELRGQGRIVTITLDPEVDTLAALKAYAALHGVDRDTWKLGRLDSAELDPLLRAVGVARVRSGGQLVHSLSLVLLDGDGRIVWRSDGNNWEAAALAGRLRTIPKTQEGKR